MEHRALLAIAETQRGLFTWRQARAAGYSAYQVRVRLTDGRRRRVIGQTLTAGTIPDSAPLRDRAAVLAIGDPVTMSGPSAARLHGMQIDSGVVCVTVPKARHIQLDGVRVLREPVGDDLIMLDDQLVTSRERTVFDCARMLPYDTASALLDRALQKKWTTFESFSARVNRARRRHGIAALLRLVEGAAAGARSTAERLLLTTLREAGITGWDANREIHDEHGLIGVGDVVFAAAKLVLEVDGRAWHTDAARFQLDRSRQNRLVNAGWTVLRFTWDDLTKDPAGVVATVRAALARASVVRS